MATRAIVPRADNEGSLGTAAKWWQRIFTKVADIADFHFETESMTPTVDNTKKLGSESLRFLEVRAVTLYGTATEALYADLAEHFTIKDEEIPEGSVISVSDSSFDAEICNVDCCDHIIGVISKNPAYIMNTAQKEGNPICVKGRVYVRVVGPIKAKQVIVSTENGCARAVEIMNEKMDKIGVALASNSDVDVKLVECFIY